VKGNRQMSIQIQRFALKEINKCHLGQSKNDFTWMLFHGISSRSSGKRSSQEI
jgi:hypothetical protein